MHNGKPYFHNNKTNHTVWEKPFEVLLLLLLLLAAADFRCSCCRWRSVLLCGRNTLHRRRAASEGTRAAALTCDAVL
jgi:hypothetical protein